MTGVSGSGRWRFFHGPLPEQRCFIHRDFHPGNLLWRRRRLTGVVDWESASVGPPDVDVGHCRLNFLYQTPELAEQLAVAWRDITGSIYDPWADVAAIIGVLDGLCRHPPTAAARFALESTLARALAELGAQ